MSETPALHIHLIAVGGTGMAPLACLLQGEGHVLTGSDGPLYPPMSTLLAEAGIVPFVGFSPEHLSPRPDLVVVGNAVPRSNPEAVETERLGLPRLSMPEALARFFLADRRPLVVAGTHGKTTTSSMAAWVDSFCGADPGFLVGGVPVDLGTSFRKGGGARFVIEGDEYNAAYFDRGAKFLHYKPETLVLTSVEHDHVDLYPTRESLLDAYERLVALVPERGAVIACADAEGVAEVVAGARAEVVTYGASTAADVRFAAPPEHDERGTRFRVVERGGGEHPVRLGVWGSTTPSTRSPSGPRRVGTASLPRRSQRPSPPSMASSGARRSSPTRAASPSSTTSPTTRPPSTRRSRRCAPDSAPGDWSSVSSRGASRRDARPSTRSTGTRSVGRIGSTWRRSSTATAWPRRSSSISSVSRTSWRPRRSRPRSPIRSTPWPRRRSRSSRRGTSW